MRNPARILLTIFVLASAAMGQDSTGGIKAGPTVCLSRDEYYQPLYDAPDFLGWKVGLFWSQRISAVFSIQPEVCFAFKGANSRISFWAVDRAFHFNYVEFPLLLNARVAGGGLEFFAGPSLAFLLGHSPLDWELGWPLRGEPKGHDFGLCHGARIWWRDISFEVQLLRGLISAFPDEYRGYYHKAIVIQVGYRFFK